MRRVVACALGLLAVATLAACGGSGSSGGASPATPPATNPTIQVVDMRGRKTVEVDARDDFFTPNGIEIDPGTTVTWKNAGNVVHNVMPLSDTADFGGATRFGVQTSAFGPGATYSYTFPKAGTYNYSCSIHTGMIGRVVVG